MSDAYDDAAHKRGPHHNEVIFKGTPEPFEPRSEHYARRQAEALEKIEAALVEILVELRRSSAQREYL